MPHMWPSNYRAPNFGVAKPMKGGPGAAPASPSDLEPDGDQFPPVDELTPGADAPESESSAPKGAAMDRLTARQNQARQDFARRFADFSRPATRQIVRRTFR